MSSRILVINPNSSTVVTAEIDRAVAAFRACSSTTIDVIGLADGPPGIQSQRDVEAVVPPLLACVQREEADAYVVACYSDPGLFAARELTVAPVYGIAESGILTALTLGARFGVVSILENSIPRHLRHVHSMGVITRMAGDRALGLGVAQLADESVTWQRMLDIGRQLRDTDGANVLVLGCAGMGRYRRRLAEALEMPVVEPTQAATGMALTAVALANT